jgi:CRP-like cAMP-binding protein
MDGRLVTVPQVKLGVPFRRTQRRAEYDLLAPTPTVDATPWRKGAALSRTSASKTAADAVARKLTARQMRSTAYSSDYAHSTVKVLSAPRPRAAECEDAYGAKQRVGRSRTPSTAASPSSGQSPALARRAPMAGTTPPRAAAPVTEVLFGVTMPRPPPDTAFPGWLRAREDFGQFLVLNSQLRGGDRGVCAVADLEAATAKPSYARTTRDLMLIVRELRRQPFAAPLDTAVLERLAATVQYRVAPARSVVCTQGEPGDAFYIVLEGRLDVDVRGLGSVATLHGGDTFGELALTSASARQATVRVEEQARLLCLMREDYVNILAASRHRWLHDTAAFLAAMPTFATWGHTRLCRLAQVLVVHNAAPGTQLVQQGVQADRVYFVRSGTLSLVHRAEVVGENRIPLPRTHAGAGSPARTEHSLSPSQLQVRPLRSPLQEQTQPLTLPAHAAAQTAERTCSPVQRGRADSAGRAGGQRARHSAEFEVDHGARLPTGVLRATQVVSEPVGEVRAGALFGLGAVMRREAHPFSLVALTSCQLMSLSAKYMLPNQLVGYDVLGHERGRNPRGGSPPQHAVAATRRHDSTGHTLPGAALQPAPSKHELDVGRVAGVYPQREADVGSVHALRAGTASAAVAGRPADGAGALRDIVHLRQTMEVERGDFSMNALIWRDHLRLRGALSAWIGLRCQAWRNVAPPAVPPPLQPLYPRSAEARRRAAHSAPRAGRH